METIWLLKVIFAHLLTDFVFQPAAWIRQRREKHFASGKLYLHIAVTALGVFLFTGPSWWPAILVIAVTHWLIDGIKSFAGDNTTSFLTDQAAHLLVIVLTWLTLFHRWSGIPAAWNSLHPDYSFWIFSTAIALLTVPAGIFIGQMTRRWRKHIPDSDSLASAGKWIGIIERLIVLAFVLLHQYSAIGLLIAAKGIIRFNEKDRAEAKTEYLVIGTLFSVATALLTGMIVEFLAAHPPA